MGKNDEVKGLSFEMIQKLFESFDAEQKKQIRQTLGVIDIVRGTVSKSRTTGKFMRTDKVYENNLNKQMTVLISALNDAEGISVEDWAKKAVELGLQTQQDPIRIVSYYKKNLLEMGYAKVAEEVKQ